jgi:hypothetical protein
LVFDRVRKKTKTDQKPKKASKKSLKHVAYNYQCPCVLNVAGNFEPFQGFEMVLDLKLSILLKI